MAFDPERKPSLPRGVREILKEKQDLFDPKIGEDKDGFTLEDAESLGWSVDLFDAHKHFPGRGLVRVRSTDSDEGRYGVLKAIYEYELKEHERAKARAGVIYGRLVQAQRQKLLALDAAKEAREEAPAFDPGQGTDEEWAALNAAHKRESKELRQAIKHAREALRIHGELDAFGPLELPPEYLDGLCETERPRR